MSALDTLSDARRDPFAILMDILATLIITLALLHRKEGPHGNFVARRCVAGRVASAPARLVLKWGRAGSLLADKIFILNKSKIRPIITVILLKN